MFEYTCTAPSVIRPGQMATWIGTDRSFAAWLITLPNVRVSVRYLPKRRERRAGSYASTLAYEAWNHDRLARIEAHHHRPDW